MTEEFLDGANVVSILEKVAAKLWRRVCQPARFRSPDSRTACLNVRSIAAGRKW